MGSSVLGELLILFLLIVNCSRIFFLKYGKVDTLTILSPVCIILSILQIFAWDADIFSISLVIISVFCFITNFRALLRFCSGLYVDHYSIGFKLGAILVLLLSFAETGFIVYFRPIYIKPSQYNVEESTITLSGNFTSGFQKSRLLEPVSGKITVVRPKDKTIKNQKQIILLKDKRASRDSYSPLIYKLAQKGYTVYTGNFFAHDSKWFNSAADIRYFRRLFFIANYFKNKVQFNSEKEFFSFLSSKELHQLVEFAQNDINHNEDSPFNVFIIGDWMNEIAIQDYCKENENLVYGSTNLINYDEYSTAGFGFSRQIAPIIAYFLGYNRTSDLTDVNSIVEKILPLLPEVEHIEYTEETIEVTSDNTIEENTDINEDASFENVNVNEE